MWQFSCSQLSAHAKLSLLLDLPLWILIDYYSEFMYWKLSSCSVQPAKKVSPAIFFSQKTSTWGRTLHFSWFVFFFHCLHHVLCELLQQPEPSHLNHRSVYYYYSVNVILLKYEASQLALLLFFKPAGHVPQGLLVCLFSARTTCPLISA